MLQEWWRWLNAARKALVLPLEHTHSSSRNCPSREFKAKRAVTPEQSQCSGSLGCGMVHSFSARSNRAQTVGHQPPLPYTDQRLHKSPYEWGTETCTAPNTP